MRYSGVPSTYLPMVTVASIAIDPEAEIHGIAVKVDLHVGAESEHQRAPKASIIVFTSATSCPPHSSSTVTPLGSRAFSNAGV